jgi:hypothetical protein
MSENKHLAPVCIIYLDGNRLSPACEGAFRSVFALDRLNGVGECTVTYDRHDLSDKDARVFSYDTRLSLHLGYKDDTQEVFNGEITGLKTKLSENEPSSFIVIASSCLWTLPH